MWGAQLGNSAYHYGYNSPLLFSDPTGLFAEGKEYQARRTLPEVVVTASRHDLYVPYIHMPARVVEGGQGIPSFIDGPSGMGVAAVGYAGGSSRSKDGTVIGITAWRLGLDAMAMSELPFLSQGAGLFSAGIDFWHGDYYGGLLSLGGMAPGIGAIADATKVARRAGQLADVAKGGVNVKSIAKFWPNNDGALGEWTSEFLMPGTKIDRFGSGFGKFFSPKGTPMNMRALPPQNTGAYNAFEVVKPFEVQSSIIAPAFDQMGYGKQYMSPVNMNILLKRRIIVPIK